MLYIYNIYDFVYRSCMSLRNSCPGHETFQTRSIILSEVFPENVLWIGKNHNASTSCTCVFFKFNLDNAHAMHIMQLHRTKLH